MIIEVDSADEMKTIGENIGTLLRGGEIIELIGDVGSGKTTFVKGIAAGLDIDEYIQSPSFTINRVYQARDGIVLSHYDFYRLNNAGIMASELSDAINQPKIIKIIEWAGVVDSVLPMDRLSIHIETLAENSRKLEITSGGESSMNLVKKIKI